MFKVSPGLAVVNSMDAIVHLPGTSKVALMLMLVSEILISLRELMSSWRRVEIYVLSSCSKAGDGIFRY